MRKAFIVEGRSGRPRIGILGGMGPEATAALYLRLIRRFQQRGAVLDDDFPEMIIISLPIPDVVGNPEKLSLAETMIVDACRRIERAGAGFIAVPCNTVMRFIARMRASVSIPVMSIVEETVSVVNASCIPCVGVLGTAMTIEAGLYDGLRVRTLLPTVEQQSRLTAIIIETLSGRKDGLAVRQMIRDMKRQGARKVILGCTELPLLVSGEDVIDTIDVLADAIIREVTR